MWSKKVVKNEWTIFLCIVILSNKTISNLSYRLNPMCIFISHLLTQLIMYIQCSAFSNKSISPNLIDQLFSWYSSTFILAKYFNNSNSLNVNSTGSSWIVTILLSKSIHKPCIWINRSSFLLLRSSIWTNTSSKL